jgi:hypothetical protein
MLSGDPARVQISVGVHSSPGSDWPRLANS